MAEATATRASLRLPPQLAIEDFQSSHSRNMAEPLPPDQPIEQKVKLFLQWVIFKINSAGGAESGAEASTTSLTKAAISRFLGPGGGR